MSRAYRLAVQAGVSRVIKGKDKVESDIDVLPILCPERMGDLLGVELAAKGYEVGDGIALKDLGDGVTVEVELETGKVSVTATAERKIEIKKRQSVSSHDRKGMEKAAKAVQKRLQEEVEKEADAKAGTVDPEATAKLEKALGSIRKELDRVSNKVVAAALKEKAASMGDIKEMDENEETGELTITVEV